MVFSLWSNAVIKIQYFALIFLSSVNEKHQDLYFGLTDLHVVQWAHI